MGEEVKGAYFVVARRYVEQRFGADALEELIAEMPVADREVLDEPSSGAWYPERVLMSAQKAMFETVAYRDLDRYENAMAGCIELGVNTFFRVLLGISTPDFLLRQYPTLYSRVRRGASRVVVERSGPRTLVHYLDFPHADDELNHRAIRATFRTLVGLTGQPPTEVRISHFSTHSITATVDLEANASGVQPAAPDVGELKQG